MKYDAWHDHVLLWIVLLVFFLEMVYSWMQAMTSVSHGAGRLCWRTGWAGLRR